MLADFFEDYSENAPHKGLKLKSPREYLRSVPMATVTIEFSNALLVGLRSGQRQCGV